MNFDLSIRTFCWLVKLLYWSLLSNEWAGGLALGPRLLTIAYRPFQFRLADPDPCALVGSECIARIKVRIFLEGRNRIRICVYLSIYKKNKETNYGYVFQSFFIRLRRFGSEQNTRIRIWNWRCRFYLPASRLYSMIKWDRKLETKVWRTEINKRFLSAHSVSLCVCVRWG